MKPLDDLSLGDFIILENKETNDQVMMTPFGPVNCKQKSEKIVGLILGVQLPYVYIINQEFRPDLIDIRGYKITIANEEISRCLKTYFGNVESFLKENNEKIN